jgi:hypothetical protein
MIGTSFQEVDVIDDPLDMMNNSMDIEVGRDAPQSDAIQPFQRESFLQSDGKPDQDPQYDFGNDLNFDPEGNPNFSVNMDSVHLLTPKGDKRKSIEDDSIPDDMNLGFEVSLSR